MSKILTEEQITLLNLYADKFRDKSEFTEDGLVLKLKDRLHFVQWCKDQGIESFL